MFFLRFFASFCFFVFFAHSEFVIRQFKGFGGSMRNPYPNAFSQLNHPGERRGQYVLHDKNDDRLKYFVGGYYTYGSYKHANDIWSFRTGNDSFVSNFIYMEWKCIVPFHFPLVANYTTGANIYSLTNYFGGRYYCGGWMTSDEEIMIIGGYGYSNISNNGYYYLSDVFVVNVTSSEQKYLVFHTSGNVYPVYGTKYVTNPSNRIGARRSFLGIPFSSNQAVIFGGYYYSVYNDLFICDFSSDSIEYTWFHGSQNSDEPGIYGEVGVYSSTACPGGRSDSAGWINKMIIFIFGGYGYGEDGDYDSEGYLNDLWNYNISSNQFAFQKGSNKTNQIISLFDMKKDFFNTDNMPGSRQRVGVAKYSDNLVVFFGGYGISYSASFEGSVSELWLYDIEKNEFMMTKYGQSIGYPYFEGQQNVLSKENCPSGRYSSFVWKLPNGNMAFIYGYSDDTYAVEFFEFTIFDCFGESNLRDTVCSSNGKCVGIDVCECFTSNLNDNCGNGCFGYTSTSPERCYGHGDCVHESLCKCSFGYSGIQCEQWSCSNISRLLSGVCGGKGICVSSDVCKCTDLDYQGDMCSYTGGVTIALVSVIAIPLIIIALIIVIVVFVLLMLLLCYLGKRLKKVEGLEGIDILLEEQKIARNSTVAHLTINKNFFKINYSDVQLKKVIGEGGGDACVYLAEWHSQEVALKLFKLKELDEEKYTSFENEVKIQSSLHHPNVLRFLGAILEENKVGFIMEMCKNGDLESFFRLYTNNHSSHYPVSKKMRMLKEIASAMKYLHSLNVVHRDLKPQNVLITANEETRVMDFGLSKLALNTGMTQTVRVGTSAYMAPEVLSGHYDEKVDVFSFGILVYVVLTEKWMPYGEEMSVNGVEMRVRKDPQFRPKIEKEDIFVHDHQEIIAKMWSHDPVVRPDFDFILSYLGEKAEGGDSKETVSFDTLFRQINSLKTEVESLKSIIKVKDMELSSLKMSRQNTGNKGNSDRVFEKKTTPPIPSKNKKSAPPIPSKPPQSGNIY